MTLVTQNDIMLTSFGNKNTQKIKEGERVKGLTKEVQEIARRKLRMLNNSQNITNLMIAPSNQLENRLLNSCKRPVENNI